MKQLFKGPNYSSAIFLKEPLKVQTTPVPLTPAVFSHLSPVNYSVFIKNVIIRIHPHSIIFVKQSTNTEKVVPSRVFVEGTKRLRGYGQCKYYDIAVSEPKKVA